MAGRDDFIACGVNMRGPAAWKRRLSTSTHQAASVVSHAVEVKSDITLALWERNVVIADGGWSSEEVAW